MADYISREAAIEKITALINKSGKYTAYESGADDACFILEHEIPAADVRPVVRGEWIWELADNGWANHICSCCGYTKNTDIHVALGWNFCPNCGADMRGDHGNGNQT